MNEPPPILLITTQYEGIARWHGSVVHIESHQVPRFLWTTASIDVYLDGQCILKTGGRLNPTGSCTDVFSHGGSDHIAELSWGVAFWYSFPYEFQIDGISIVNSRIRAKNWYLAFMIASLFGIVFGAILFLLGRHIWQSMSS